MDITNCTLPFSGPRRAPSGPLSRRKFVFTSMALLRQPFGWLAQIFHLSDPQVRGEIV